MDEPRTDLDDPVTMVGLKIDDCGDGSPRVVRHYVLASGEQRPLPSGRTEYQSWHGPWVLSVGGCGSATTCPECREEWRRRFEARAALKAAG